MAGSGGLQYYRLPQYKSVDVVRWLRPLSAFDRFIAAAVHNPDVASSAAIEIFSLNPKHNTENPDHDKLLNLRSSWPSPSRITSLRTSESTRKHLVVALSTFAGSVYFLYVDPVDASIDLELSVDEERPLHSGPVSAVDIQAGGYECVTVGEDGRVNLVSVCQARLESRVLHDSRGLVSYTAAKWGSQEEFATGGLGFGLQWWDRRKAGGLVSQFKGNWSQGSMTGLVHSIDIYPSRNHICVVGGSSGMVLAWDRRWQQQPIFLSGGGLTGTGQATSESDVWEVQYDIGTQTSGINSAPTSKIFPVMMCSEDGILAVVEQGEAPIELLAEDCAINSFDINPQHPSEVVCGIEWESIGILMRQRESLSLLTET
ncbi:hypothetical protein HPP92_020153 [Vanilla planifolia]|uniref:Nuclear pore complex protein NUP43 n=1 Tax=Vanilla planifolia TaxID=51239 RepID=A0A835QAD8_VANPL|nr:hypothetical protein HPP92_020153 [Vanilla planifolia]